MARHRRKGRPCKFESLETRYLLAGDVTARIHHGDLIIKGDSLANGITITAGPVAGTVVITGVDAGGSPTNVADTTNGSAAGTPNGTITLSGFTRNLKIDMKGGDDTVLINDAGARLTVPGKAELKGGNGNDEITIDGAGVNRSLKIELGKGDDELSITDLKVNGKTTLKGNSGSDDVTIAGSTFSKLKTPLGSGDDSLDISGTTVSVKTRLYGERGADTYTAGDGNSFTNFKKKGFIESESATSPSDTSSETSTPLTLAISGAASVNEGALYTLSLVSSGSGTSSISQWTITWGDDSPAQVVNGNPSSVTHTFADGAATRTISATATNSSGTTNAGNTVSVAVGNVAPSLSISGAASVKEGSLYILSLSAADPGADTISQWTINWGDGSAVQTVTGNPSTVAHTFTDGPATCTISATATDEDGTFNAGNSVTVTVSNAAPAASISGASTVLEGSLYTLNLSSSDPGADTISQWIINWGDGSAAQTVTGNPPSVTHTFTDGPAARTISATATDEDGTINATNSVSVTVVNVAPTLLINGATSVQEGAPYTLQLSSTDPGADTISQWTINWGDNTPSQVVSGNPATVTHTFADGVRLCTIIATATDEDSTFASTNTLAVIVDNALPELAISGASSVDEASLYTLHLSSSDPGADTISKWNVNWGDGTPIQIVIGNPTSVTHIFADGAETRTISATATDEDGTYDAGNTVTVTVNNVAPTLSISGASEVDEGSGYSLNLTSSDPGADTIDHWLINWGDGTPNEVVSGNPASTFHVFADGPNTYTISATATDEDGTYSAGNTLTVNVQNVPPSIGLSGPSVVSEGVSNNWTLGPFLIDFGQDEVSEVIVHWGDGNDQSFPLGQVLGFNSLSHTYAQGPNAYTISVDLVDEDGTYVSVATGDVTVNNVGPTVSANYIPYGFYENTPVTISGNYFDADATDAQTLKVEWGDPNNSTASTFALPATNAITAGDTYSSTTDGATLTVNWVINGSVGFSVVHNYLDDGPAPGDGQIGYGSQVMVTVTDDDGAAGTSSTYLYVYDTPATLEWDSNSEILEYANTTFHGAYTDPGLLDAQTLVIYWGDPNNSAYSTFALPAIQDAPGTPTLSDGQTINSTSDNALLTISSIDFAAGRVEFSIQHQYVDDGLAPGDGYSGNVTAISSTITGDDSSQTSTYRYATISNIAPTLSVDTPANISEGTPVTITGTFTDPGLVDGHTLEFSWSDSGYGSSPFTSSFALPAMRDLAGTVTLNAGDTFTSGDGATLTIVFTDAATGQVGFSIESYLNDGSSYVSGGVNYPIYINLAVQDDDGAYNNVWTSVTVENEAPTLAINPVTAASEGSPAIVSGTFADPGRYDSHIVSISWGDSPGTLPSYFAVSPMLDINGELRLFAGNTFISIFDSAVLTITSVDLATGTVGFSVEHQYLDDGPWPGNGTSSDTCVISVSVSDDDYVSDSTNRLITINNVTPTVAREPFIPIFENDFATLRGTFSDPGLFDAHTLTVNWGDPNNALDSTFDLPAVNASSYPYLTPGASFYSPTDGALLTITSIDPFTLQVGFYVQHQYLNDSFFSLDNHFTVTVTVADDDGDSGTGVSYVTVNNGVPGVALNSVPSEINENEVITLSGNYIDIGILDAHNLVVTWSDPNNAVQTTFAVPGIQDAAGATTLHAGDTINSSTDSAILTIISADATTGRVDFSVEHQYLDDGFAPGNSSVSDDYSIQAMIFDEQSLSGALTPPITFRNVTPEFSAPTPASQTVSEGGAAATLTTTLSDPGTLDVFTVDVDWGDGTVETISLDDHGNNAATATPYIVGSAVTGIIEVPYETDWFSFSAVAGVEYTFSTTLTSTLADSTLTLFDTDGTTPLYYNDDVGGALSSFIRWTPPADGIYFIQVAGFSGNYGVYNLLSTGTPGAGSGSGTNTHTVGGTTYTWDSATRNLVLSHTYLDDPAGAIDDYTVTLTPHDDDGGTGTSQTATVTVNNTAPIIPPATGETFPENAAFAFNRSFTDPGLLDSHTITVDWDDPNTALDSTFAIPATNILASGLIYSSTDDAILSIGSVDTTTGLVTFSFSGHYYVDDGLAPGNGTVSDLSTVVITVTDDDGGSNNISVPFTIENLTPTVALIDPPANISANYTLGGSFSDGGLRDVHSFIVNWGNSTSSAFTIPATDSLAAGQLIATTSAVSATLKINSINLGTGKVEFEVGGHSYLASTDGIQISPTIGDDDATTNSDSTTAFDVAGPVV